MTLKELLNQEKLKRLKVLNQWVDLDRNVTTVESTETPDIAKFLGADSLLITTGMAYENNQKELKKLINELHELPCAGLCIKLGRFIVELDLEVMEYAQELGFPIIQIPVDMTLGDIYHEMLACLWDNQNKELTSALNIQKKFSNLILKGASTKTILNSVEMTIGTPVAIMSPFGQIVEHSKTFLKRRIGDCTKYEIQVVGNYPHYLLALENQEKKKETTITIEQILLILGVILHKKLYMNYSEMKSKEEFFAMLSGEIEEHYSNAQLLRVGERYGLKRSKEYHLVLGKLETKEPYRFHTQKFTKEDETYVLMYEWLDTFLRREYRGNVLIFPVVQQHSLLFFIQGEGLKEEDWIQIHEKIKGAINGNMYFSFGNAFEALNETSRIYKEVVESQEDGTGILRYYRPKKGKELLDIIPLDQRRKYCEYMLKELANPQEAHLKELKNTLRVFLSTNQSLKETAEIMFVHRNTIKYRIKKCEDLLGKDLLGGCDGHFQLQLAMEMLEE